jgi:hypothetical protein
MQELSTGEERFTILKVSGKTHWIGIRKNLHNRGVDIFSMEDYKKEKKLCLTAEEVVELRNLLNAVSI